MAPRALILVFLSMLLSVIAPTPARAHNPDPYNALVWNPQRPGPWYEWWYYKVVVPGTNEAFFFTYGVVNPGGLTSQNSVSYAYTSIGSFADHEMTEDRRPVSDFSARRDSTFVQIGQSNATDKTLTGQLTTTTGENISWNLTLEPDWKFNAMGWGMFKDWLFNIYWYPAQASAFMSGVIHYKNRVVTLDHAPAYQDRNWGKSFPKWWAWLVSNHFKNSPGTVLAAGGGLPRLIGGIERLEGVTIGLRHQGKQYTFRPTEGDLVRLNIHFGTWEVRARNRRGEQITISAFAPREKFMDLQFLTPQGGIYHDYEALKGYIHVQLFKKGATVADLDTNEGGIEFGSADEQGLMKLFQGDSTLQ